MGSILILCTKAPLMHVNRDPQCMDKNCSEHGCYAYRYRCEPMKMPSVLRYCKAAVGESASNPSAFECSRLAAIL